MENKQNSKKNKRKDKKPKEKKKVSSVDLLEKRVIYLTGEIDERLSKEVIDKLMKLDMCNHKDITLYINSPGGEVREGLAIYDVMNMIKSDIKTICIGRCASMASILLINGTKGKRYVLPHSRVMIHQVSTRMGGTFSDIKIEFEQLDRCKQDVYAILAKNMNKSIEEMEILCDRDNWFIGKQAIELGIADNVIE